jgi:hypothetical protein
MIFSARFIVSRTLLICLGLSLALSMTACAKPHMISTNVRPKLAIKSNKAILVIIRSSAHHVHSIINNYLDGKMIGQTQGKCYFVTEVHPGMHYLIAAAQNRDVAYMHLAAGRIYFLRQAVLPGNDGPTTRYIPMTFTDATMHMKEAVYLVYDTENSGKDMTEKDVQEVKKDYEREVKEDAGRHRDTRQYQGYNRV